MNFRLENTNPDPTQLDPNPKVINLHIDRNKPGSLILVKLFDESGPFIGVKEVDLLHSIEAESHNSGVLMALVELLPIRVNVILFLVVSPHRYIVVKSHDPVRVAVRDNEV